MPSVATEEQIKALSGKLSSLPPAEAMKELRKFEESIKVEKEDDEIEIAESDLERIVKSALVDAKKEVKKKSEEIERKYNVPAPEARMIVEKKVAEHTESRASKQKENKIVANCLRSLYGMKKGGSWDDVRRAYHAEAEYLGRDTLFTSREKEERAMSVGTDTAGGFLSPEIFSSRIYENLEKYGLARQHATVIQMESEIMRFPKVTADLTAAVAAEAGTIAVSDITTAQLVLQPLKLAVLGGPFSDELLLNAEPAITQVLQESAGRALAKQEDNNVFIGTSASFTGLLELTAKTFSMGAGKTAITDVTFDDIIDLVDTLASVYVTDDATLWCNKKVTAVLRKIKISSNYAWAPASAVTPGSILGYPYRHVVDMTAAPAAGAAFAAFGDLKNVWIGLRGGLRIDLLTEGTVNSVNLGETASYALRVIEYFDSEVVDTSSLAVLKTAAA